MGGIDMVKLIIFIIVILSIIIFCTTRTISSGSTGKNQRITIWIGIIFLVTMLIVSIIHFIN